MPDVNGRRAYSSPLRRTQAEVTRAAVVRAAHELFTSRGYGATTVDQVAERAGVSKPTVFHAVGNKQALLRAVRDLAIAGDDRPVPVARRPAAAAIRAEPDQRKAVERLARHLTEVASRYGVVYEQLRVAAASGEPELRALWETEEGERLEGARAWVGVIGAKGTGPADSGTATDALWFLMAPDTYNRLVGQRGWSGARYRRWLAREIGCLFGLHPQG